MVVAVVTSSIRSINRSQQ